MICVPVRRRLQEIGSRNIVFLILLVCVFYLFVLCLIKGNRREYVDDLFIKIQEAGAAKYLRDALMDSNIVSKTNGVNSTTNEHAEDIRKYDDAINIPPDTPVQTITDSITNTPDTIQRKNKKKDSVLPIMKGKHWQERKEKRLKKKQERKKLENNGSIPVESGGVLPERANKKRKNNYLKDLVVKQEWTPEMAQKREEVFASRGKHIRDTCSNLDWEKYSEIPASKLDTNIRWATKYNLMWCPIFKAASTTWVKNFLAMADEKKIIGSLHGRVRALYPPPEDPALKKEMLQSALKVIIVRHPFDRLLSAYRDKMLRILREKDPYHLMQKEIAGKYKDPYIPEVDPTPSRKPEQPSFNQFLLRVKEDMENHITRKPGMFRQVNLHWRPYWTTCSPCQMNYDVIAKVETLDEDQEYIIHEAKLEGLAYNAHTHASNFDKYNGTSEATKNYFSSVPRSLLTKLVELYRPDFDIFGYTEDEYIQLTVPGV